MTVHAVFDILGLPSPQGSKTRMPNGAMVEAASATGRANHKSWRTAVAEAAREFNGDNPPLDGAIYLDVTFRFPMPKSRRKADRERGWCPKTTTPDLDKLLRALGDGLKAGGLIVDDARISAGTHRKIEVIGWTGASVMLRDDDAGFVESTFTSYLGGVS